MSDTARLRYIKKPYGNLTKTLCETLLLLMETSFLDYKPVTADNDPSRRTGGAADWETAEQMVAAQRFTRQYNLRALQSTSILQYYTRIVTTVTEIIRSLTGLLRGCIVLGYTARYWLKTKVISIPKPRR